jgi:hypothetical protein
MRMKPMMWTALGCLLLSMTTAAVASEHDDSIRVGKRGEFTLTRPTQAGEKVLQPGTYVVQHRVSADSHFVRFTELKQVENSKGEVKFAYTEPSSDEVRCNLEPAGETAKETSVTIRTEGGGDRITKVRIKGENVVHEIGRAPRD